MRRPGKRLCALWLAAAMGLALPAFAQQPPQGAGHAPGANPPGQGNGPPTVAGDGRPGTPGPGQGRPPGAGGFPGDGSPRPGSSANAVPPTPVASVQGDGRPGPASSGAPGQEGRPGPGASQDDWKQWRAEKKEEQEKRHATMQQRREERQKELQARWGAMTKRQAVRDELRLHAERMARLQRMRRLADEASNKEMLDRIDKLAAQENGRHDAAMARFKNEMMGNGGPGPSGSPPSGGPPTGKEAPPAPQGGKP